MQENVAREAGLLQASFIMKSKQAQVYYNELDYTIARAIFERKEAKVQKKSDYILGLDLGVNSVGWAVVDCALRADCGKRKRAAIFADRLARFERPHFSGDGRRQNAHPQKSKKAANARDAAKRGASQAVAAAIDWAVGGKQNVARRNGSRFSRRRRRIESTASLRRGLSAKNCPQAIKKSPRNGVRPKKRWRRLSLCARAVWIRI